MLPLDGQETRAEKMNVTVDTMTGFYARYPGLPSRFQNGSATGQQTGRLSARPKPTPARRQLQSVWAPPRCLLPQSQLLWAQSKCLGVRPPTLFAIILGRAAR